MGGFDSDRPECSRADEVGRAQTLIEFVRQKAMSRSIEAAVRDPKVLRAIIINKDKDIRSIAVLNILGQAGGTSLAIDEQL